MVRTVVSTQPADIAAAVERCPAVAGLSAGPAGNVFSYVPGARVVGVRKVAGGVAVHVVARFGTPLAEVAHQVRAAVSAVAPGCLRIDVAIDDLEVPPVLEVPPEGFVYARRGSAEPAVPPTASGTGGTQGHGGQAPVREPRPARATRASRAGRR